MNIDQTIPTKFDIPFSGLQWLEWYEGHKVFHPGRDLNHGSGNDDCGQLIYAPDDCLVEYVHTKPWTGRGFGIFVILNFGDGTYNRMAHMQNAVVFSGEHLKKGDLLGAVGNTGTNWCHLHWEAFYESMAEIQRKHYFKWRHYPTKKPKHYITQHYQDPFVWLEARRKKEISPWAEKSAKKALDKGIITDWSNPQEIIGGEKLEWILENLGLFMKESHQGSVTLERYAVALDRAGLLQ